MIENKYNKIEQIECGSVLSSCTAVFVIINYVVVKICCAPSESTTNFVFDLSQFVFFLLSELICFLP